MQSTDKSTTKYYRLKLFFLSLFVSIVCLAILFPIDYLTGVGRYWDNPANEINVALAALRYYIAESQWMPLGQIRNINAPEGINILYEGGVPLFAFFAKVMNQIFGVKLNTLLSWSLVSTMLQGMSFAYLMFCMNVRRTSVIILASIIGMLMPAYLWRLENAVALPLFLINFTLAFYFIVANKANPLKVIQQAIVLSTSMMTISILINPYITAMVLPIYGVTLLQPVLTGKLSYKYSLSAFVWLIVSMILIAWVFGYLSGNNLNNAVGGYDFFSMNIWGPFDIGYSSLFKMIIPSVTPANATGGQQEGMQYLGVGWLLLIIWSALLNGRETIKAIQYHYLLILIVVGMAIFSLSNKIYFGNSLVFAYSVPKIFVSLTESFRASGRFFWPMGYLLVAASVVTIARKRPKYTVSLLCFAIIVQYYDTYDLRKTLWNILLGVNAEGQPAGKYVSPYSIGGFQSDVMHFLFNKHQHFKQYPSWWCGGINNQMLEIEMSFIASQYLVTQNSFYTARANKDCYAEDLEARHISTLEPNTLYIFGQRYNDLEGLHNQGVDLKACRVLELFTKADGKPSENFPVICSAQFESNQLDLARLFPNSGKYGGLFPIDLKPYINKPIISHISVSGSFDGKLFRAENLINNHIKEDDRNFPSYWIGPELKDAWVRLDLDNVYNISEVRLLNTTNGGVGDRAAGIASLELYNKNGTVSRIDKIVVAPYPQWTSIKVNQPNSIQTIKIFLTQGKPRGTGLNKIQLVGRKELH